MGYKFKIDSKDVKTITLEDLYNIYNKYKLRALIKLISEDDIELIFEGEEEEPITDEETK